MSSLRALEIARHARDATLLALLPWLMLSGGQNHLGHRAERNEPPVFADAEHAGEAHHWEPAGATRISRCPACLAPTQPFTPTPGVTLEQVRRTSSSVPSGPSDGRLDSRGGRGHPPRAPPSSELS